MFEEKRTPTAWKPLLTACNGVRIAIDAGVDAHLERYAAEVERLDKERDMREDLYKHLEGSVGFVMIREAPVHYR